MVINVDVQYVMYMYNYTGVLGISSMRTHTRAHTHTHTHIHTVFNVGEYRRATCGASKSHMFYHPHNEEANKQRR